MVLFESFEGRGYNDSPRAVFEELRGRRPDLHYVWSYRSAWERPAFPGEAELVRRHSWRYYARLARARWWVDNYGLPKPCDKPRGTTYVQTWHGTPMKLMFFDAPRVKAMAAKDQAFYQRFVDRWDYLVSPSRYFESTFVRAARFRGELIRSGMPRNDALFAGNNPEALAALRLRLGIPEGKTVVLYAPTYRGPEITGYVAPDLDELERRLGPDYFVLLRQHYYTGAVRVLPHQMHFARDASRHGDVNELMLVADVLVTDYSSMMFDFAVLRRPMVFYTPDLDEYVAATGTYVDLRDVAPGPLAATPEELGDELAKLDDLRAAADERIGAFLERFCDYDTGDAARQVVDRVWGGAPTS
jgi:CDP-glycerol glycerophosphotransferase